jgi:hypothetical protein
LHGERPEVNDMAKKKDKRKRHDEQARAAGQDGGAGPPARMKRVEPVMGFCTPAQTERFLGLVPAWEKAMTDSGIVLLKYWLEVSAAEQTRRLESRIHDPRKIWKLSDMDLKSYSRWYDYSRARDAMFAATDTAWAPWFVAGTDDKKRGRLNIISHLLSQVPYQPPAHRDVVLPKRQRPGGYTEPDLPLRHIPTPF